MPSSTSAILSLVGGFMEKAEFNREAAKQQRKD